jgi:DNA-binding winged helix-turn-helix (wHTH) protein
MMTSSFQEPAESARPDHTIYLEKDIFFNARLGQLESATATVALNFRESILLRLLVEDRVRKQAVIDAAWGDNGVIVTDASYHQLVRSLRKKFAEIGLPAQSIKTLPRFGLEYLREHPSGDTSIESTPALAPALLPESSPILSLAAKPAMSGADAAAPAQFQRWGAWGCGVKWPVRLVLLILPFLVGLLIGHLDYRGNRISTPRANEALSHAVPVSPLARASGHVDDNPGGGIFNGEVDIKALRASLERQRSSESTRRFQCI